MTSTLILKSRNPSTSDQYQVPHLAPIDDPQITPRLRILREKLHCAVVAGSSCLHAAPLAMHNPLVVEGRRVGRAHLHGLQVSGHTLRHITCCLQFGAWVECKLRLVIGDFLSWWESSLKHTRIRLNRDVGKWNSIEWILSFYRREVNDLRGALYRHHICCQCLHL